MDDTIEIIEQLHDDRLLPRLLLFLTDKYKERVEKITEEHPDKIIPLLNDAVDIYKWEIKYYHTRQPNIISEKSLVKKNIIELTKCYLEEMNSSLVYLPQCDEKMLSERLMEYDLKYRNQMNYLVSEIRFELEKFMEQEFGPKYPNME